MTIKDYTKDLPPVNLENRRGKNLVGKGGGRKRKLSQQEWAEMILLYNDGWTVTALAAKYDVSRNTIYDYLKTAAQAQQEKQRVPVMAHVTD